MSSSFPGNCIDAVIERGTDLSLRVPFQGSSPLMTVVRL